MTVTIRDLVIDVPSLAVGVAVTVWVLTRGASRSHAAGALVGGAAAAALVRGLELLPARREGWALVVGVAVSWWMAAAEGDVRQPPRLVATLAAISALGAFATTPDTERAVAVGAVTLAVLAVTVLAPRRRVDAAGLAAATVLLLGWVAATDGQPRTAAVIGALGCAGALPVLRWVRRRPWMVLAAHAAAVYAASRVAGLRSSAWESAAITAGALVVLAAVLVPRRRR